MGGSDGACMERLVEAYNRTNPARRVHAIAMTSEFYTRLYTATAAGRAPDIATVHERQITYMQGEGMLTALDTYSNRRGVDWNAFTTRARDSVTVSGRRYAVPLDTFTQLFIFNIDKFRAAGIPLTANNQVNINSFQELRGILERLRPIMPEGDPIIACTQTGMDPFRVWAHFYFQMGGPNYVTNNRASVDRTIGIRSMEYMRSLYEGGFILPGQTNHQRIFQAGQAAIMFGGTWAIGELASTPGLNIGVQAFPNLFGTNGFWGASHNLIMPVRRGRSAEDAQGAFDFMYWAASEGGLIWAEAGMIPIHNRVRNSREFQNMPFVSGYAHVADHIVYLPMIPAANHIFSLMTQNLDLVWLGQADPGATVDAINRQLQDLIDN
jgi:multiple sugar transport system substrate-binding protein